MSRWRIGGAALIATIALISDTVAQGAREGIRWYYEFEVERPARQVTALHPAYPDTLRRLRIEGEVQVQFGVDTLGVPDLSRYRLLTSTDDRFTAAVLLVLPKLRYTPAERHGTKVRQIINQRFTFKLPR